MDQVCRSGARHIFDVEVKPETRIAYGGDYDLGRGHAIGRKELAPFSHCVITYPSLGAFDSGRGVVISDQAAILRGPQVDLDEVSAQAGDTAKMLRPVVLGSPSATTMRDSQDVLCRAASGRPERRQGRDHRMHTAEALLWNAIFGTVLPLAGPHAACAQYPLDAPTASQRGRASR
jgi:hypothetical protein